MPTIGTNQYAPARGQYAKHVFRYRLIDKPSWLTMIAPGCDLAEARRVLKMMYPGRVVSVR